MLDEATAKQIAYYKGEQSPGVFAPKGWRCQVWYGSGGSVFMVTPALIDPASAKQKFNSEAVELTLLQGGTSGRYEAAKYASWFFPAAAAKFVRTVDALADTPVSQFDRAPYANDSLTTFSDVLTGFTTPPNRSGLGTDGYLESSQDPIAGFAFLERSDPEYPNVIIVRIRLRTELRELEATLLRLNREHVQS